ncbi:hypothetical protein MRX96_046698 [Rhipicephalus microplus]
MNNFSQLLETAKRSPFARPFAPRCDSSMDSTPAAGTTLVPRTFSACAADARFSLPSRARGVWLPEVLRPLRFRGGSSAAASPTPLLSPLDLVKCRIQTNPGKYKGIFQGFSVTIKEEGARGLGRGWAPTAIGYSLQGLGKFGFYEVFKILYSNLLGEELSYLWRTSLYLAASASAEFFADIALCPMEACKVRIQTQPGCPPYLSKVAPMILKEEGLNGFYKGISPLWMRQIPYTMMKFACFERTVELLYKHVVPKPRDQCSKPEQLVVTFVAGYIAGVFCAVVSHPADTVVSKLNQEKGSTAIEAAKKLGMAGLWKGLTPRIIMIEMPQSLKDKLAKAQQ